MIQPTPDNRRKNPTDNKLNIRLTFLPETSQPVNYQSTPNNQRTKHLEFHDTQH
jgi:hypothetical protein